MGHAPPQVKLGFALEENLQIFRSTALYGGRSYKGRGHGLRLSGALSIHKLSVDVVSTAELTMSIRDTSIAGTS